MPKGVGFLLLHVVPPEWRAYRNSTSVLCLGVSHRDVSSVDGGISALSIGIPQWLSGRQAHSREAMLVMLAQLDTVNLPQNIPFWQHLFLTFSRALWGWTHNLKAWEC